MEIRPVSNGEIGIAAAPATDDLVRLDSPFQGSDLAELQACLESRVVWAPQSYEAFGRRFQVPRLQAWYADSGLRYRYSDNLIPTNAWPDWMQSARAQVESATGHAYNSVLLTCYRDGNDSVDWHADDEKELGPEPWIASLSVGASRLFSYRLNTDHRQQHGLRLEHGDLILMKPGFQQRWQHQIPEEPQVTETRINLTFRKVV
jgi:alkylated DNA repair dioxygenase AlkB